MEPREKAIEFIRNITGGSGFNWKTNLGPIEQAKMAQRYWNEGMFAYGMECGAIIALAFIFEITEEELK